MLDLAADNTVDWEQVDDRVHDLDEELKVDRTMSGLASRVRQQRLSVALDFFA